MPTATELPPDTGFQRYIAITLNTGDPMSQTLSEQFSCPYCMAPNELEVDLLNDLNQQQIVDCQVCCQPIEVLVSGDEEHFHIIARTDDE